MSFEITVGDFLALIELTNKIRKAFVGAPSHFKNISDEVRSLSIVTQDADVALSKCEPDTEQKTDLQEIAASCCKILSDLETIFDKYSEMQTYGGSVGKRVKRVWKKLTREPEDVRKLRDRITLNVTLLKAYVARISAETTIVAKMEVDRLDELQDNQERLGILDWLTPITTSRYNYLFQSLEITKFKYKPIGLEGPAFRLLRLLKGGDDFIQGQLFDSKLPPPPEYARDYIALSYTWGGKSTPCEMMINGSKMAITKNAYLALRDLRCQEKDRIIWIDALCINQNDDKERGEQVQQMGSIYRKAERVIIWLGEATYDTDYVMHYMKQMEKESARHASNNQEISDKQWMNIWSAVAHSLSADQRDLLIEGLRSLLRRNWFKRVWIIQEVANARVAEITCGCNSVSASIFAHMLSLLDITPDPHCQPIIDIIPGPLRNSSWWVEKRDLYTLLVKFCESEATDPRDKIYALLDISSDASDTDFLRANYEKNLQDVIFNTTLFLLNCNQLSSPICRLPDWTLSEFLGILNALANEVLKCAMNTGHEPLVRLLIVRDDVNINMKVSSQSDQTPLSWAAENGHEAVVKLLLEKGAELETKDYYNQTPLSHAADNGHEVVVKLLLEKGAEMKAKDLSKQTPLSYAAKKGFEVVVKLLLEKGAELDTKDLSNRQTPLSQAAEKGHETVVKLLLEKGAELEAKDLYERTPLSYATENGHEAAVKLLLEKGAKLETKNSYKQTPLSRAASEGHGAVVRLLLEKGARLETEDSYKQTPLSHAAKNGHETVVKLLLEKDAELETKAETKLTPLSYAAKEGYEAVVKLLLEKGARLETEDSFKQTPLSHAADNGHEVVVRLLLEKGAEMKTKDRSEQTPLSYAAKKGFEAVVKLLLEKGAELETKDKYKRTPLSYATENGHMAVVKLLLKEGAKSETENSDR